MTIQRANTIQKRLRILGADEIEAIYGRPRLTPDEQGEYFSLSQPERELLQELRSIKSQVYFVLQLGYFKSKHQFFVFDLREVEEDVQYILEQHFNHRHLPDLRSIDKDTRLKQQRFILKLYNYRLCHAEPRRQLKLRAQQAATISAKPIYIFRDLMTYLTDQRIVAPGYSWMQDTIGNALTFEQNRLTSLINAALENSDIEHLKQLLEDSPGLYEVTQLKREPKDFSAGEIKREIRRGEHIQHLYQVAKRLLPNLGISNESIKYYASLVTYYSIYKLKRLDTSLVYLYLLCFIYHRYKLDFVHLCGIAYRFYQSVHQRPRDFFHLEWF